YKAHQSINDVLDNGNILDMLSFLVKSISEDDLIELQKLGEYNKDSELSMAISELKELMEDEGYDSLENFLDEAQDDVRLQLGTLMEKMLEYGDIDLDDDEYLKYLKSRFEDSYKAYESIQDVLDNDKVLDMLSFLVEKKPKSELNKIKNSKEYDDGEELVRAVKKLRKMMKKEGYNDLREFIHEAKGDVQVELGSIFEDILDEDGIFLDDVDYLEYLENEFKNSIDKYQVERVYKAHESIKEVLNDQDILGILSFLVDEISDDELSELNISEDINDGKMGSVDSLYSGNKTLQDRDKELFKVIKQIQRMMDDYDDLEEFLNDSIDEERIELGNLMKKVLYEKGIDLYSDGYIEHLYDKFKGDLADYLDSRHGTNLSLDIQSEQKLTQNLQNNTALNKFNALSVKYSNIQVGNESQGYETLARKSRPLGLELDEKPIDDIDIKDNLDTALDSLKSNDRIKSYYRKESSKISSKGYGYSITVKDSNNNHVDMEINQNGQTAYVRGGFDEDSYTDLVDMFIRTNDIRDPSLINPLNIPFEEKESVNKIIEDRVNLYVNEKNLEQDNSTQFTIT
ncbi:MAG: hypothetical protein HRT87_04170, partial [Legionellales bacterium]|nr:hypothetical protein [Legionellales bacterium]